MNPETIVITARIHIIIVDIFSQCIIDIIEKKYSDCLNDEKGKRRMIAGLMRSGYNYSDIRSALADIDLQEDDSYEL